MQDQEASRCVVSVSLRILNDVMHIIRPGFGVKSMWGIGAKKKR